MKMLALITALTALTQLASARISNLEFTGSVVGTVKIQTKWMASCMALGCPPSQAYTQVSLVRASVTGYRFEIAEIVLLEDERRIQVSAPQFVIVKGTRIKNGQKVEVVGTSHIRTYDQSLPGRVYATISGIESVKLVR